DPGRHGDGDPLLADRQPPGRVARRSPLRLRRSMARHQGFWSSGQTRFRIRVPKSSAARNVAPHSSQSTANADLNGASHARQRRSTSPPHSGHSSGTSASNSSNHRRTEPHETQKAAQSPRTLRRSSRSQSEAFPTVLTLAPKPRGTL